MLELKTDDDICFHLPSFFEIKHFVIDFIFHHSLFVHFHLPPNTYQRTFVCPFQTTRFRFCLFINIWFVFVLILAREIDGSLLDIFHFVLYVENNVDGRWGTPKR